jgi:hypothetical protein
MGRTPALNPPKTAIPTRFRLQRERVLRILARWESSTRFASEGMAPTLRPAGPR